MQVVLVFLFHKYQKAFSILDSCLWEMWDWSWLCPCVLTVPSLRKLSSRLISLFLVYTHTRLPVRFSHRLACLVGGVRHILEGLLLKVVADPSLCTSLPAEDDVVLQAIRSLMSSQLPSAPPKTGGFGRGRGGFRGRGAGFRTGR